MARAFLVLFLVLTSVTTWSGAAVATQADDPGSTASSTAVTSTTVVTEAEPTPAPAEPDPGEPAAVPEPGVVDDGHSEDIPVEAPPEASVVPPPPVQPVVPSVEQQQVTDAITARLEEARLSVMVTVGLEAQAATAVRNAEADVADLRSKLEVVLQDERKAVRARGQQRRRIRRWAVEAYAGGGLRRVNYVLESGDINDVPRRLGLARGVLSAFQESLSAQNVALKALVEQRRQLEDELSSAEERLAAARDGAAKAGVQLARRRREVTSLGVGRAVSIGGVAFPITGPTRFTDTFGAPRMTGTPFAHTHEGVDIFAEAGVPVVAFERGVAVRLGTDVLGGTKLWLVGQSGTRYYYAHLQGYAAGLVEGQLVDVGQTVGYVGNSGNARTTPPHLHFEIHPGGGSAVNPYPVITQIAETVRSAGVVQGGTATPPRPGTVVGGN